MKPYILCCAIALTSCAGKGVKNADTLAVKNDTSYTGKLNTPAKNMEYCFVNTGGNASGDTTAIHLVIKADKVSGNMSRLLQGKDRRTGTLAGRLYGNVIKAVWNYMQEGQTDTLAVEFKLSPQQLAEKPFMVNSSSGREQLNAKAAYTIVYNLDNCVKFKAK